MTEKTAANRAHDAAREEDRQRAWRELNERIDMLERENARLRSSADEARNLRDALRVARGAIDAAVRELDETRAHAAAETESKNAAWSELAGVALLLGYARGASPDFGEVDVVEVRELAGRLHSCVVACAHHLGLPRQTSSAATSAAVAACAQARNALRLQVEHLSAALAAEREKVARLERERDDAIARAEVAEDERDEARQLRDEAARDAAAERDEIQRMLSVASCEVGDDRGMETECPVDAIRAVVRSAVCERDELAAQLAALREAAGPAAQAEYATDEETRALRIALADTAAAVEAYTRRVQAEALESAADSVCDHEQLAEGRTLAAERTSLQRWLRARAAEIRGGR